MTVERQFISEKVRDLEVEEYLRKELRQSVFSHVDIKRTPMGTRLIVYAMRPGVVIGSGGSNIKALTAYLKNKYDLQNPHIKVQQVEIPELDAQIMAEKIASFLERGYYFKKVAYRSLQRIIEAGARGVEIRISGKLPSKRSKCWKFKSGYNRYCGETVKEHLDVGYASAVLKPGAIGIVVRIVPPTITFPDELKLEKKVVVVKEEKEVTPDVAPALDKKAEEFDKKLEADIKTLDTDEAPKGVEVEVADEKSKTKGRVE